ncbi:MOCS3-1 [Symbiodinium pilosum]|uniref:MOCS3-1 protein n=1 Tax=Symbiodinium pilosum TaxID=2952 RepID=A0A812W0T9_SYMPI|nr:MOCS3-1 [Symbiodinium pilosum]
MRRQRTSSTSDGKAKSQASVVVEEFVEDDYDDKVPFKEIMDKISEANTQRGGHYVPKVLPGVLPIGAWDTDSGEEEEAEQKRQKSSSAASEEEEPTSPPKSTRPPILPVPKPTDLHWNTWSKANRAFTPSTEVGTLKPKQLNLWEEARVFSPSRTWPVGPLRSAAPEFYDDQRQGLPIWQAVSWKHTGPSFPVPPRFKRRPGSAQTRGPAAAAPPSAQRRSAPSKKEEPRSRPGFIEA